MRALALLAAVPLLGACEREERRFEMPSSAPLASGTERRVLVAGGPPIEGETLDPDMPGYVESAWMVSEGGQLYNHFNCVGCHARGGGAMGPPFLDETWSYGSSPYEIASSILDGRPNGMPSYRGKLGPQQLYQLVGYVRAIGGLVRSDAVPARTDHIKVQPAPTLYDRAVPKGSREQVELQPEDAR